MRGLRKRSRVRWRTERTGPGSVFVPGGRVSPCSGGHRSRPRRRRGRPPSAGAGRRCVGVPPLSHIVVAPRSIWCHQLGKVGRSRSRYPARRPSTCRSSPSSGCAVCCSRRPTRPGATSRPSGATASRSSSSRVLRQRPAGAGRAAVAVRGRGVRPRRSGPGGIRRHRVRGSRRRTAHVRTAARGGDGAAGGRAAAGGDRGRRRTSTGGWCSSRSWWCGAPASPRGRGGRTVVAPASVTRGRRCSGSGAGRRSAPGPAHTRRRSARRS